MTNEQRAEIAFRTMLVFTQHSGQTEDEIREGTAIYDLIADLYHLGGQYGLDVDYIERMARDHYDAERKPFAGPFPAKDYTASVYQ